MKEASLLAASTDAGKCGNDISSQKRPQHLRPATTEGSERPKEATALTAAWVSVNLALSSGEAFDLRSPAAVCSDIIEQRDHLMPSEVAISAFSFQISVSWVRFPDSLCALRNALWRKSRYSIIPSLEGSAGKLSQAFSRSRAASWASRHFGPSMIPIFATPARASCWGAQSSQTPV